MSVHHPVYHLNISPMIPASFRKPLQQILLKQIPYRTKECQYKKKMCKTVSHSGLSSEYKHLFSRYYSFPKTLREFLVFLIEGTKKKKR